MLLLRPMRRVKILRLSLDKRPAVCFSSFNTKNQVFAPRQDVRITLDSLVPLQSGPRPQIKTVEKRIYRIPLQPRRCDLVIDAQRGSCRRAAERSFGIFGSLGDGKTRGRRGGWLCRDA